MTYLNILEKIKILFNLMGKYNVMFIFIGFVIFSLILKIFKKINNKKMITINLSAFLLTLIIIIVSNYKILSKTFDNFLDIFFTNIYFPSIYVYIFMIISSYVIIIVSILNKKLPKIYKVLNTTLVSSLNIILLVILNIIAKDKIDIFSNDSLYTNINLVSMLELSINIYILWLITISAVYIINIITNRIIEKKEQKVFSNNIEVDTITEIEKTNTRKPILNIFKHNKNKEVEINIIEDNNLEVVNNDIIENTTIDTNIELENNIKTTNNNLVFNNIVKEIPDNNYSIIEDESNLINLNDNEIQNNTYEPKFINYNFNNKFDNSINTEEFIKHNDILDKILNNNIIIDSSVQKTIEPIENQKSIINTNIVTNTKELNNKYSLDDYKLFSKMLKESIRINNRTNLNLNDILNLDLLNKFNYEEYSLFRKMLKSFID